MIVHISTRTSGLNRLLVWDAFIPQINPTRILEIGSYEGASACYLIEKLAPSKEIELHCIDTWEGGIEHQAGGTAEGDMNAVEKRFHHNTRLAMSVVGRNVQLRKHKGFSDLVLAKSLRTGCRVILTSFMSTAHIRLQMCYVMLC